MCGNLNFIYLPATINATHMSAKKILFYLIFFVIIFLHIDRLKAQSTYELNSGWKCLKAAGANASGEQISTANFFNQRLAKCHSAWYGTNHPAQ